MRARLLWLQRSTAPPPLRILESALAGLDTAVLAAFCELGLPDAVQRRPRSLEELAAATGVEVTRLERVIDFAAAHGWVRLARDGRVRATRTTAFLRSDHPGGWRAWVDFAASPEITDAIAALPRLTGAGSSAFQQSHGAPFFEWMAAHPEQRAGFDRAMDAGARLHALALRSALSWAGRRRVCDVGGGRGELLVGVLDAFPHLRAILFDLPEVVAHAHRHDRMEIVEGDALIGVPGGCDTYLLVNVLHDWGDADAVTLLTQIAKVLGPHGECVVVEGERLPRPQDTLSARTDMLMLILTGTGKERTTAEFTPLGTLAGLRLDRTVRLASADRAHVFVRASARQ
jgi:hypothetical protein